MWEGSLGCCTLVPSFLMAPPASWRADDVGQLFCEGGPLGDDLFMVECLCFSFVGRVEHDFSRRQSVVAPVKLSNLQLRSWSGNTAELSATL